MKRRGGSPQQTLITWVRELVALVALGEIFLLLYHDDRVPHWLNG